MENLILYNEFLRKSYSNYDNVNEGFISKTLLALSLAFSSLFLNPSIANAYVPVIVTSHSPDYPSEFKIMEDDYDEIIKNLRGLTEHIKDPELKSLLDEVTQLKEDLDDMQVNNFNIRWNVIKIKLVKVIKKYGTSNYNIEQISKHITSEDFKRASVDAKYIKDEMDKMCSKYEVTNWERTSTEDVVTMVILGIIGAVISIFIGYFLASKITNRAIIRRNRRQLANHPQIHNPPPVHHHPAPMYPIGSRLEYIKVGSHHFGQVGVLLGVRDDGKYSIRFDNDIRLAASPRYLRLAGQKVNNKHRKDDPYNEENWDN